MSNNLTMKELPSSERPYEKAYSYGAGILSDAELLAVILRSGTKNKTSLELAHDVLRVSEVYEGLLGLFHCDVEELTKISGIGPVKAVELICIAELAKRMARLTRTRELSITGPDSIAAFFMADMRVLEEEHFCVAYLDVRGNMIKHETLFKGTVNQTTVSPREIIRHALKFDASQIVILHNHPAGDPTPSEEDMTVTRVIGNACDIVGIKLIDHIIIGDNQFVSFAKSGIIDRL